MQEFKISLLLLLLIREVHMKRDRKSEYLNVRYKQDNPNHSSIADMFCDTLGTSQFIFSRTIRRFFIQTKEPWTEPNVLSDSITVEFYNCRMGFA